MSKTTSSKLKKLRDQFAENLGDVDDLEIVMDADGIKRIHGTIIVNQVMYKVSITRNETLTRKSTIDGKPPRRKPLYTGTVSIISYETNKVLLSETRRRAREAADRSATGKDIYATIPYQCNSPAPAEIIMILRRQIDTLYAKNEDQLNAELKKWISPDQLTSMLACRKYLGTFLSLAFPGSDRNPERYDQIIEVFKLLPSLPFGQLKVKEVSKILDSAHVSIAKTELCYRFAAYLLNHNFCTGKNPFTQQEKREYTVEELEKRAFTSHVLTMDCFAKIVEFMNRDISGLFCAIALLLSGYTLSELVTFCWRDLEFLSPRDFVILHMRKDELVAAIHDFSRPLIPDSALYLRKVYDSLCKQYGHEAVADYYIASEDPAAGKAPDRTLISVTAHNFLVRAGYVGRIGAPGRPSKTEDPIPIQIFNDNYHAMLYKAGLKDDPDTLCFLRAVLFQSSTYTSYESHTSPSAQKRNYTILKSLSTVKKLSSIPESTDENGNTRYTATPKTNHEVARIYGKIEIPPGKKLIIRCAHGVTGPIDRVEP